MKQSLQMPRRSLIWAYVVVIHVVLLLLVLRILVPDLALWGPASQPSAAEVHYANMVEFHSSGDAALEPGRVLFLGDSITQGLPVSIVTDVGVNYGIGSDDAVGLLRRLDRYGSINQAAAVVVAMGSNDINRADDDEFLDNYRAVLDAFPADLPVLCSAILPIDEPVRSNWLRRSNERIGSVNADLRAECEGRGHGFVDATAALADDLGNLDSSLHDGDGLHLNPQGNVVWADQLKAGLSELGIAS